MSSSSALIKYLEVINSAPEGIRTPNLLIRSQMLYPLSYGRMKRVNPTPSKGSTGFTQAAVNSETYKY